MERTVTVLLPGDSLGHVTVERVPGRATWVARFRAWCTALLESVIFYGYRLKG